MVVPGLNDVVQGSTCAMSSRPRVSACNSFSCSSDEPRKIRGLSIRPPQSRSCEPECFVSPILADVWRRAASSLTWP